MTPHGCADESSKLTGAQPALLGTVEVLAAAMAHGHDFSPCRTSEYSRFTCEEYDGIEYGGLPVKYMLLHYLQTGLAHGRWALQI